MFPGISSTTFSDNIYLVSRSPIL